MRAPAAGEAGNINQLLEGIDPAERSMTPDEVARELNDPLALLILRKAGKQPNTLVEMLAVLDAQKAVPGGVPDQKVTVHGPSGSIDGLPI